MEILVYLASAPATNTKKNLKTELSIVVCSLSMLLCVRMVKYVYPFCILLSTIRRVVNFHVNDGIQHRVSGQSATFFVVICFCYCYFQLLCN